MVQTPYANLTLFAVIHLFCSIRFALLAVLFSVFLELLLWNSGNILDPWIHKLTKEVRHIYYQQTYTTGYDNNLWIIRNVFC